MQLARLNALRLLQRESSVLALCVKHDTYCRIDTVRTSPQRTRPVILLRRWRSAPAVTLVIVAAVTAWWLPVTAASGEPAGIILEVAADQRVSVVGRSASLKTVIEDVCYRAGVDVLFYDAADRPFGGTHRDIALHELLGRLLREESFMVETVRISGVVHVTSLRVLGEPAVGAARRARGGGARRRFEVPPVLLDTAFGAPGADAAERDAALATLAARISGDPVQLQGFLATDSHLIADAIRRYAGVEKQLREMQRRASDPRISQKIDEIVAALAP